MTRQPLHILVIDDNAEDRADMRRMLMRDSARRYRFSEAAAGAEGLRMALDPAAGRVDCVLLDYRLPDMDAVELLAAWRNGAGRPPWPVLVITGSDGDEGPAVLRAGAQDFVGKRWTSAESLARAVANAIERFGLLLERERLDEDLRRSEERYRGLFDAIDEGFCIIEPIFDADERPIDYRFVRVNASFAKQTGLSDAQGRTARELVPDLEGFWLEACGSVARTGVPVRLEGHAASMQRWFAVHAFRLASPQHHQVAVLFTDTTERRRVAAELSAATAAAETANRAKSEFLSRMGHELRSPLSVILGFAQLIGAGVPRPTAAQEDSVAQILKAGWYLLALVNEILDLSLIESGQMSVNLEAVPLAEVLSDCESMFDLQAQARGIQVRFPRFEQPVFVQADPIRIKQILINLLSNAIKYNVEAGRVEVRCRRTRAQRIRITVADTGKGLSAAELGRLFQPFDRLGQEAGTEPGTGIGLLVCKRLVELMGGEMGVSSRVGVGSRFWFELSAVTSMEPDLVAPTPSVPLAAAGGASMCGAT